MALDRNSYQVPNSSTESLVGARISPHINHTEELHEPQEPSGYYGEEECESEYGATEYVFEEPPNRNLVPACGFTVYQPKLSPWWLKLMDFGGLIQLGESMEY